jgi:plasmid replication initiation protein
MRSLKVTKQNHLVEAEAYLTLPEKRMILYAISKLDSRKAIPKRMKVTAVQFAKVMGLDISEAYKELFKAIDNLYERSIKTTDPEKKEVIRWIQTKGKYIEGHGKITFTWCEFLIPYISELVSDYTSYYLDDIKKLPTANCITIYELMAQFRATGKRVMSVKNLKSILSLQNKYKIFDAFNRRILKPSIIAINKYTDLLIDVSYIRDGNTIHSIVFKISTKRGGDDEPT